MLILVYQASIIISLILVRFLAPRLLLTTCWIWTCFTVVNLFFPPLIVVQLAVIWITYAWLKPDRKSESGSTTSVSVSESSKKPKAVVGAAAYGKTIQKSVIPEFLPAVIVTVPVEPKTHNNSRFVQEAVSLSEASFHLEKLAISSAAERAVRTIGVDRFQSKSEALSSDSLLFQALNARFPSESDVNLDSQMEIGRMVAPAANAVPEINKAIRDAYRGLLEERKAYFEDVRQWMATDQRLPGIIKAHLTKIGAGMCWDAISLRPQASVPATVH